MIRTIDCVMTKTKLNFLTQTYWTLLSSQKAWKCRKTKLFGDQFPSVWSTLL